MNQKDFPPFFLPPSAPSISGAAVAETMSLSPGGHFPELSVSLQVGPHL